MNLNCNEMCRDVREVFEIAGWHPVLRKTQPIEIRNKIEKLPRRGAPWISRPVASCVGKRVE
jgi:hypothetical protein